MIIETTALIVISVLLATIAIDDEPAEKAESDNRVYICVGYCPSNLPELEVDTE